MKFTTDKEFFNECVTALIKEHLGWSGSHKTLPSRECCTKTRGKALEALEEHNFADFCGTEEEYDEAYKEFYTFDFAPFWREVKQEADNKWRAAMVLLGVDDE